MPAWENQSVKTPSGVTKLKSLAAIAAALYAISFAGFDSRVSAQSGPVVNVSTEGELQQAVAVVSSDTTIVIAPGTYHLTSTLAINRPVSNVTLRGATENPNDVVIIGRGMDNPQFESVPHGISTGVGVTGVTIANLTVRDVYYHAIMLAPGTESPRIQNVRLINAGRQFVKAYPDGKGGGVDDGVLERSVLEYTGTSRDSDTGGIEVNTGARWTVRDNVFRNIVAPMGQVAGPAVLFWHGSRDTVIERNRFINAQREIALGAQDRTPNDHSGGVVRNNFLYRESGIQGGQPAIYVADSPNTQVLHNTILGNGTATSLIQYRYRDTRGVVIRNNLLDGQVVARDGATGTVADNHTGAASSMFVNAAGGDLHLASRIADIVDRAPVQSFAGPDFDGEARPQGASADFGADEYSTASAGATSAASGGSTTLAATTTLAAASSGGSSATAALPFPWQTTDVGAPQVAGAAGWASAVFTADGAGTDIGGNNDQFRFIYQTLDGDGEVFARVDSLERTSVWAKAGVMFRDELTGGAKHASALITPAKGAMFLRRIANDATTSQTSAGGAGNPPVWLRIARKGNAFTAYQSANGSNWTQIGSEIVYMNRLAYVGLVVTSRFARDLASARFSLVTVAPSTSTTPNQPPTVSLTAPAAGTTYTAPATMTVSASASDTDGSVAAVEFFDGGTLIAADTSSPYSVTWNNAPAGTHTLTAVARDNAGATTTSGSRQITISEPQNNAPTVALTSPSNGASFNAPASITLSATATDTDGTVAQVDFYASGSMVGSDTTSPYSVSWPNVTAGNYAVTAVARDNKGATKSSAAAQIAVTTPVNQPPSVSLTGPANNTSFTAPASVPMAASASDMDGTITKVEFYAGSTLVSTDTSSPYSATWNASTSGTFTLSAKAFDSAGASTISSGINVTVQAASSLPAGWSTADIGNPAIAGSASQQSGTYTVAGAGSDIWNAADQFRYVYRTLDGDGAISACVQALDFVNAYSKAGVMVRQSLSAGAPNMYALLTAGMGVGMQYRTVDSQQSDGVSAVPAVAPHCVRLVRQGSILRAYQSLSTSGWVLLGEQTITMTSSVFIGLAVTSHDAAKSAAATFTNVSVETGTSNQAPQVTLTTPANNASFAAPANVLIAANATDADGQVVSVTFYANGAPIGTPSAAPWSMTWSSVPAGSYSITAVARDNLGATRTSSAVTINVSGSTSLPPPPTTSARGVAFTPSTNHDTSVNSYVVEFFTAGADTTTATPVRSQDVGKPSPVNNEITVDVSATIQALPAGTYVSTVRATGPGGTARSAPSLSFVR